MQRTANPRMAVRFRPGPPGFQSLDWQRRFLQGCANIFEKPPAQVSSICLCASAEVSLLSGHHDTPTAGPCERSRWQNSSMHGATTPCILPFPTVLHDRLPDGLCDALPDDQDHRPPWGCRRAGWGRVREMSRGCRRLGTVVGRVGKSLVGDPRATPPSRLQVSDGRLPAACDISVPLEPTMLAAR